MQKIGLIAGNRKFPLLFCEEALKRSVEVVVVAIRGETSLAIKKLAHKIYWLNLRDFKEMFDIFKSQGVKEVFMAGQISPYRLFSKEVSNCPEIQEILSNIINKKADTIFSAIGDKLKEAGLILMDSTVFVKEYMPSKGTLTKSAPDNTIRDDIEFGLGLAKSIGALDIGQTVAVKHKAIVAVEALEGTDNLIKRAGRLVKGITVAKVAKPKQDMRFDVPVVGLKTVKTLIKAGAKCLAIEADRVLFIDRKESVRLADNHHFIIEAV